jgi:hypothetical protein
VQIVGTAETTLFETVAASVLAVTGGNPCKYITFASPTTNFYAWFQVNAIGNDPAPGGTGILVSLATADDNAAVASKLAIAVHANINFTSYNPRTNQTYIRNRAIGTATTDATIGTTTFTRTIQTQGSTITPVAEVSSITFIANVASSLNGRYFLISSPTIDYYIWYRTLGVGTDPAIFGRTGFLVNLTAAALTAVQVADQTRTVLIATGAFTLLAAGNNPQTVTNRVLNEVVNNIAAGTSGFTVSVTTQGVGQTIEYGASQNSKNNAQSAGVPSIVITEFITTTTIGVELQHACTVTNVTDGFGLAAGVLSNPELYASLIFHRIKTSE